MKYRIVCTYNREQYFIIISMTITSNIYIYLNRANDSNCSYWKSSQFMQFLISSRKYCVCSLYGNKRQKNLHKLLKIVNQFQLLFLKMLSSFVMKYLAKIVSKIKMRNLFFLSFCVFIVYGVIPPDVHNVLCHSLGAPCICPKGQRCSDGVCRITGKK